MERSRAKYRLIELVQTHNLGRGEFCENRPGKRMKTESEINVYKLKNIYSQRTGSSCTHIICYGAT